MNTYHDDSNIDKSAMFACSSLAEYFLYLALSCCHIISISVEFFFFDLVHFSVTLQDVFVFDSGSAIFVWIGANASRAEKHNGIPVGHVSVFSFILHIYMWSALMSLE